MSFIQIKNLIHEYKEYDDEENVVGTVTALKNVNLEIQQGSFVVVLGHNGSGKSTLAKHLNALLLPTEGTVLIENRDTKDENETLNIRKDAGMIFQNPDNQIVAGIVEEDVAFGPENLGVPTEELEKRVTEVLEKVNMTAYRFSSPNALSGGQKQRIGIAGILAMKPKCILMDEPTAMLDPSGRREVLDTVHELNEKENITVVLITHYMEEAAKADRVIVMDGGTVVMDGTPREVFGRMDELENIRLTVPEVTELSHLLRKSGVNIPEVVLTKDELVDALLKVKGNMTEQGKGHE